MVFGLPTPPVINRIQYQATAAAMGEGATAALMIREYLYEQ